MSLTRELKKYGSLHIEKNELIKSNFVIYDSNQTSRSEIIEARSSASPKSKKLSRF